MKKTLIIIMFLAFCASLLFFANQWASALELVRQKNTNAVFFFPIQGTGGEPLTGIAAGTTDTELESWTDG
ncbi:MAG: hypothetical protein ACYS17_14645, partial [Planctomycetota bacterium]